MVSAVVGQIPEMMMKMTMMINRSKSELEGHFNLDTFMLK